VRAFLACVVDALYILVLFVLCAVVVIAFTIAVVDLLDAFLS